MKLANALDRIGNLESEKSELKKDKADLEHRVELLSERVAKLVRELHCRKSEKINPAELLEACLPLFTQEELYLVSDQLEDSGESTPEPTMPDIDPEPEEKARKKRNRPAPNLERREQQVLLPEDQCQCPSCSAVMPRIGFDTVEKWGYQPATLYLMAFMLETRACSCGEGIATAKIPAQPIPRGKAMPDLLANTVVAKFSDALPFYRQSKIFNRQGLDIGATTLVEWSRQVADVVEPVVYLMAEQILAAGYVQADETGLPVLVPGKNRTHHAYLWAYGRPYGQVVYDFSMTRAREGPNRFLEDFQGKLQTDGYAGYNEIATKAGVERYCCFAHARRKFEEALETSKSRSGKILKLIQSLYRVERKARLDKMSFEERLALRQDKSKPILQAIKDNLDSLEKNSKLLPKSPLGKAVAYARKLWPELSRFADDGEVEIDNNLIENGMRSIAVGRKNFLFAGSEAGGHKAATLYSLMESCKRLEINPQRYLTDILTRIPTTSLDELRDLTPLRWKQLQGDEAADCDEPTTE